MNISSGGESPFVGEKPNASPSPSGRQAGPRSRYARYVKPILDRTGGLLLLLVTSPVIAAAGLAILVKLGRPIFYTQERVGMNGNHFKLYKLRTMIPDRRIEQNGYKGPERRKTHKSPNDPRVAPVGRKLRAMRLDELPQFWNVVKGDMSLVGPRPELPEIVRAYEPWQHSRHHVKPGVTGPWQISERNGKLMHECTYIDLDYIAEMSLMTDLRILAETPKAMIGGRKGF